MNKNTVKRLRFDEWWDKNKPNICESEPDVCSYAHRAWEAAISNTSVAYRCGNCLHIYEEKVSMCDCLPDKQEWIQVYIIN